MELNEAYLLERIKSLEQRLNQLQQQYNQHQQALNQSQANINATVGALSDSKEMLAYLNQKEPEKAVTPGDDLMDVKPAEA
jgi:phage shock protein A